MPTFDEIEEMVNNCTYEWTTYNGINDVKFTGSNGNSIFIPAARSKNEDTPLKPWYSLQLIDKDIVPKVNF